MWCGVVVYGGVESLDRLFKCVFVCAFAQWFHVWGLKLQYGMIEIEILIQISNLNRCIAPYYSEQFFGLCNFLWINRNFSNLIHLYFFSFAGSFFIFPLFAHISVHSFTISFASHNYTVDYARNMLTRAEHIALATIHASYFCCCCGKCFFLHIN